MLVCTIRQSKSFGLSLVIVVTWAQRVHRLVIVVTLTCKRCQPAMGKPSAARSSSKSTPSTTTAPKTKIIKAPRVIKFGSDFSGIDAGVTAMSRLFKENPNKCRVKFVSDILPEAHKVMANKPDPKPEVIFTDILERERSEEVYVDVYVWTPPCQSFSLAGKGRGSADPRGSVLASGVKFILNKRPRVTIFENVKGLTRFPKIVKGIQKRLGSAGYKLYWKVLNAADFQVPQSRERLFMVGIKAECIRREFQWPEPISPKVTLSDVLDKFDPRTDKPGRLPNRQSSKEFVKAACKEAHRKGTDPLTTPIAIDIDCSSRFQSVGVNVARTLTRTRGGQGGPWISSRGRRTTPNELLKIQGFSGEDEVPWRQAGVNANKIGQLLGNAAPVPMMGHILSEAMFCAGVTASKVAFPLAK